jgi:hypothetical protein
MLTDTEVHYLVGFLYLHTRRTDVTATVDGVLGEKVYDTAAEKARDVDIVVVLAGGTAMIGVEVKDERRPLDVITVEQVAAKLLDMPGLTERFIVSSSGFTKPAIKKAQVHGLRCLRLCRGALPVVATVDISQPTSFCVTTTECLADPAPNVHFQPRTPLSSELAAQLTHAAVVVLMDGTVIDVAELSNRLVTRAVNNLGRELATGDHPFKVEVSVTDPPTIKLPGGDLQVTHALVSGIAHRTKRDVPIDERYFLEDENGRPFALATVAVVDGQLFGLMLNETRNLGAFLLPEALRSVRPIRYPIPSGPRAEARRASE